MHSLDALTLLFKIGHFSLIWYTFLHNKTFQLFDWSIILVFWRTRFNLNSCVLTSFSIKWLMKKKVSRLRNYLGILWSWSLHRLKIYLFFEECSLSFSNKERFTTRTWKLAKNIRFTELVQLIFHICEKRYFCDRIVTNEINFLISGASQVLRTHFQ